jgi:MFS family permease
LRPIPVIDAIAMNAVSAAVARQRSTARWPALAGLWGRPDFVRLWTAQTVSMFGSEITAVALPLTAVLVLGASPSRMGLLAAADKAPFLLFGLLAGVWVDRLRCRSVMVAADLGRAVLLGSIPVAALLGVLTMEQLYVVGFLAGILTVFFDVAYQSYLPALVQRDELAEGNSKLEASKSISEMAGPIVGSAMLQIAAAPCAIVLDALSFVLSGLCLRSIPTTGQPPARARSTSVYADVTEGIRLVLKHPLLRPIALCSATLNLFFQMIVAVYVLYVTTQLHLPPAMLGVVLGIGSVGALAGALLAARAAKRFGTGPAIIGAAALSAGGAMIIALANGDGLEVVPVLIVAQLLVVIGIPIYNINQISLRQAIAPDGMRGRVNATMRFLVWGTMPIGSLLGGVLGEALDLRPTIALAAVGMLLASGWVAASPVRNLRSAPSAELGSNQ